MPINESRENIAAKIAALLEKTVDKGCTEAEALQAAELAGKLMTKYNLTMTEVEIEAQPYEEREYDSGRKKDSHPISDCLGNLARYCGVKFFTRGSGKRDRWTRRAFPDMTVKYCFYGAKHDMEIMDYLYHVIKNAMEHELKLFKRSYDYRFCYDTAGKRMASFSFLDGMADRINYRLYEMCEEQKQEYHNEGKGALIVLKEETLAQRLKDAGYSFVSVTKNARSIDGWAYEQGDKAGSGVSLNRGMGSGTSGGMKYLGA